MTEIWFASAAKCFISKVWKFIKKSFGVQNMQSVLVDRFNTFFRCTDIMERISPNRWYIVRDWRVTPTNIHVIRIPYPLFNILYVVKIDYWGPLGFLSFHRCFQCLWWWRIVSFFWWWWPLLILRCSSRLLIQCSFWWWWPLLLILRCSSRLLNNFSFNSTWLPLWPMVNLVQSAEAFEW